MPQISPMKWFFLNLLTQISLSVIFSNSIISTGVETFSPKYLKIYKISWLW